MLVAARFLFIYFTSTWANMYKRQATWRARSLDHETCMQMQLLMNHACYFSVTVIFRAVETISTNGFC